MQMEWLLWKKKIDEDIISTGIFVLLMNWQKKIQNFRLINYFETKVELKILDRLKEFLDLCYFKWTEIEMLKHAVWNWMAYFHVKGHVSVFFCNN